MQMRVREQGDEVHIELIGVAGRQHSVLQALNDCQRTRDPAGGDAGLAPSDIRLRVGTNDMRIQLKGRNGQRFEAAAIYQCLRRALIEQPRAPAAGTAAT
jgi:hypothetical protein